MSSIFELPSDLKQILGSTEQLARMTYEQVPATREISNTNFSNGAISFKFSMSGQKHWVPNKSYLRTRVKLSKANGTQLNLSDNIAPNMDLTSCLFQSAEFRMGDKTVSRISDNLSQVDALETRLNKSKSWLDGAGASTNFWQKDFKTRQADVCVDGVVVNTSTSAAPQSSLNRVNLGFDAAGGAGNDRNAVSYVNATGIITFALNGGAALPADVRVQFPVGSYFQYTSIQGAVANDPRYGKPLLVIAGGSATTIQVAPLSLADVGVDGRTDFIKVNSPTPDNDARKVRDFETIWCPPLSIFKVGKALPSGKYELVLNPQTAQNLQKAVIESIGADKVSGVGGDYVVEIISMYLYIETVYGPRGDNLQFLLDLEQTRCQSDTIAGNSLVQKQFDVSPSTVALTVCYQDSRAGLDTRVSSTKFKSYNVALDTEVETKLDRFFCQYSGQNFPSIDSDEKLDIATQLDWTTQRYVESQLYSGAWFDTGSAESANDYKTRGMYIHFKTPRDSTDRSTRVSVNSQFSTAGPNDTTNLKVLVFDHSKQLCRVTVEEGNITNLQIEDA
jgi:hypothetical protein